MSITRRGFLLASSGLLLTGCAEQAMRGAARPEILWPQIADRPAPVGPSRRVTAGRTIESERTPPRRSSLDVPAGTPLPRNAWTKSAPVMRRTQKMGRISRITIHHEGWKPVHFADMEATVQRLEMIRRSHVGYRHWGDIGYHFIVDRAGRAWEARPLMLQGAHVRDHNEHNIGVMVLGNFDRQRPSSQQLQGVDQLVSRLMREHHIHLERIYTHRELGPTSCPGDHLQPHVDRARRSGQLG